ncbi:MAG: hypothetical protein H7233_01050, partial [Pseudorhodobacter sp.]|nr:hypothetical protein [Frankiaceae bacterium]
MSSPRLSERTIGDLVAGRAVSGDDDLVAALRLLAAPAHVAPPTPSTALAALLADGVTPVPTGVLPTDQPARWALGRRWVTGGAVGVGAALLALTGAAAAQALPAPLQQAVSGAVRALTPFDLPGDDQRAGRDDGPVPAGPGDSGPEQDGREGGAEGPGSDAPSGREDADEADVREDREGDEGAGADGADTAEDEVRDRGTDEDGGRAGGDSATDTDRDTVTDTTGDDPDAGDNAGMDLDAPAGGGAADPSEDADPTGPGGSDPAGEDSGASGPSGEPGASSSDEGVAPVPALPAA